ncbi:securin [Nothoprocta perdicaria]|uniref:Securin n=1 Tax=Nothoprocta perdicaria TaxID=30464 RepID=A0A8C6YST4_NOTPE|nr:securin [Nothoprocta perdicaria]
MATLIFIDKENEQVGASKNQLRRPSASSMVLSEKAQVHTPLPKKVINASPATSLSVRKALGNVNRTVEASSKKEQLKTKKIPCAKKITEDTAGLESNAAVAEETYPEIEKMFPYDPLDFETFDVPEENSLNNLALSGVPLMMLTSLPDVLPDMIPSPVKLQHISWESGLLQSTTDFLSTLDNIIDMPPVNYDL